MDELNNSDNQTPQIDTQVFQTEEIRFPYTIFAISISLAILLGYRVFGSMLDYLLSNKETFELNPLSIIGAQLLFLVVPVYLASNYVPLGFKKLVRIDLKTDYKVLLIAILGLIAFQFLSSGYLSVQESLVPKFLLKKYYEFITNYDTMINHFVGKDNLLYLFRAIVVVGLFPAVCEEILFRGFLQRNLEESMRPSSAILITAFIFGVSHLNPVDFIPLFAIGLYFGIIAYNTKSITIPIILHFLNNSITVIMIYFSRQDSSLLQRKMPLITSVFLLFFGFIAFYSLNVLMVKISNKKGREL